MLPEEYTQILQRYINLCQVFGLAPLTRSSLSIGFNISKTRLVMSLLCLFLQTGHVVYHVIKENDKIRLTTMTDIIHFVWMFQCLLTNIFVAAQSLHGSKHLVAYVNQLCKIDQEIRSKQIENNCQPQSRKHLLLMIFVIVMTFVLPWILYGFLAYLYPQLTPLFAFMFVPIGFMSIRVCQTIHSIELLNDHLDIINNRLRSISVIHRERKEELVALRQLYGRCWNALQLYNSCFGFSNFLLLLFYSSDVLHGIYILFLNMHGLRPDLVVLYGICFIPSAISLFAITNAAVRCQNKAKETGVCLGNIWSLSTCHVHLKRFSVQVIHQRFLIAACGFFIVNFEFLGGIAVGFSNLLLLFIQFEISEKTAN